MLQLKQLELVFGPSTAAVSLKDLPVAGPDAALQREARALLRAAGAEALARQVKVEWNARLRSCAGRAHTGASLISLNPRLAAHGPAEIDRTMRHELAHLLAQFRAGRRRIPAHGEQWRRACRDLGIPDEKRCHNLPFPIHRKRKRYYYRCPSCRQGFPRVYRIRRAIACLACCRKHNGGKFDARFRLKLIKSGSQETRKRR